MILGRVITISVLLIGVASVSFAREPIDAAFGQRLGAYFDPASATEIGELTFRREKTYGFTPVAAYPGLEMYHVLLTPITHRIYGIWAQRSFGRKKANDFTPAGTYPGLKMYHALLTPITYRISKIWGEHLISSSVDVCENEQDILMEILRRKYGTPQGPEDCWFCFRTITIRQESRSIESTCTNSLIVRYTDHDLEKQSKEEYAQMKKQHVERAIKTRNTKGF
jgi:hypothetical protein